MAEFGEFTPRKEPGGALFAIKCSRQQMSKECEMLTDRPEASREFLGASRVAKTAHATLAFARGLMAILCPVV